MRNIKSLTGDRVEEDYRGKGGKVMTGFEDNENIQRGGAEGLGFNVCWQVDSRCVRGY